jgi:hypothetical protein
MAARRSGESSGWSAPRFGNRQGGDGKTAEPEEEQKPSDFFNLFYFSSADLGSVCRMHCRHEGWSICFGSIWAGPDSLFPVHGKKIKRFP